MKNLLRTDLAPIGDAAWRLLRETARTSLVGQLSSRRFVDVEGPHGWEFAAVNLGRLRLAEAKPVEHVRWGIREVQPLVEFRTEFALDLWELDNVERGALNPDLKALLEATHRAALFEEHAVYHGLKDAGIIGILGATVHPPLTCKGDPASLAETLEHAIVVIENCGIGGPFGLVVEAPVYERLMIGAVEGYPIRKRVEPLFAAGIRWSPAVQGAVVLSARGGDYVLSIGQDHAIGYQAHDAHTVTLYLTASFTFQVREPAAAVAIRIPSA